MALSCFVLKTHLSPGHGLQRLLLLQWFCSKLTALQSLDYSQPSRLLEDLVAYPHFSGSWTSITPCICSAPNSHATLVIEIVNPLTETRTWWSFSPSPYPRTDIFWPWIPSIQRLSSGLFSLALCILGYRQPSRLFEDSVYPPPAMDPNIPNARELDRNSLSSSTVGYLLTHSPPGGSCFVG